MAKIGAHHVAAILAIALVVVLMLMLVVVRVRGLREHESTRAMAWASAESSRDPG